MNFINNFTFGVFDDDKGQNNTLSPTETASHSSGSNRPGDLLPHHTQFWRENRQSILNTYFLTGHDEMKADAQIVKSMNKDDNQIAANKNNRAIQFQNNLELQKADYLQDVFHALCNGIVFFKFKMQSIPFLVQHFFGKPSQIRLNIASAHVAQLQEVLQNLYSTRFSQVYDEDS